MDPILALRAEQDYNNRILFEKYATFSALLNLNFIESLTSLEKIIFKSGLQFHDVASIFNNSYSISSEKQDIELICVDAVQYINDVEVRRNIDARIDLLIPLIAEVFRKIRTRDWMKYHFESLKDQIDIFNFLRFYLRILLISTTAAIKSHMKEIGTYMKTHQEFESKMIDYFVDLVLWEKILERGSAINGIRIVKKERKIY